MASYTPSLVPAVLATLGCAYGEPDPSVGQTRVWLPTFARDGGASSDVWLPSEDGGSSADSARPDVPEDATLPGPRAPDAPPMTTPPAPPEVCHDAMDNNRDGRVDEGCVTRTCEELGPHNCNNLAGDGAHCAPSDNTARCPADWFQGWCRRAVDPVAWASVLRRWVQNQCAGTTTRVGDTFTCVDRRAVRWTCTTPLAISWDGGAVRYAPELRDGFDLAGRHACYASAWLTPANPWLAVDLDHDGQSNGPEELLGEGTLLPGGAHAAGGFQAAALYDDNQDGQLDARDLGWASLRLFTDHDNNRRCDPGELRSLDEAGILWISLRAVLAPRCGAAGCEVERAPLRYRDRAGHERTGAVVDVLLRSALGPG